MGQHKLRYIPDLPPGMEGWTRITAGCWVWIVCGLGHSLTGDASSQKTAEREARLAAHELAAGKGEGND